MRKKKILTLILALVFILRPGVVRAEIQIDQNIINQAKTIEKEVVELGNFKRPLKIFLSTIKDGRQEINNRLKEGIRVSRDRTAIGVRDFINLIEGLDIFWNHEHRMVVIKAQTGKEIVLPIDKSVIFIDGVMSEIDVPATIDPQVDRTFLPMRTLANALGYSVNYDQATHTASLVQPGYQVSIKDAVGEEVPTMQSLLDPVNEIFQNQNQAQAPEKRNTIKTFSRSVETAVGSRTKNYVEEIEIELMNLINEHRVANGVKALDIDYELKTLSDIRAAEFSENMDMAHTRPDGSDCFTVGNMNGENLVALSLRENNAQVMFDTWKESKGHNENMLRETFESFYISVVLDGNMLYGVNVFKY